MKSHISTGTVVRNLHLGTWQRSTSRRTHPLERDERPIIVMDFAVRKARADDGRADDDLGTCLAIVDSSTVCMRAMASETREATHSFASSVADFVKNQCGARFRLRCDNAPSIMAAAEKVKATVPDRVVVETTPRHSSASNGLAERDIQSIGGQLRTLRYDTQNRHKTRITPDSAIWPWMVRYAGFRVTRCARGAGGITPLRAAYDQDYTQEIVPFAP